MKRLYLFSFLFLSVFPGLLQAVSLNEVEDDVIEKTVGYLDQTSWCSFLKVSRRFYQRTCQGISSIKIRKSVAEVLDRLPAFLLKQITPEVSLEQGKVVQCHTALEALDLSGSGITESELKDLVELIQKYLPNLRSLNLSRNRINSSSVSHLSSLTQLKELDLSWNSIRNLGVAHLSTLTQLEKLNLSHNPIGALGVSYLFSLTQLKYLDLRYNQIGDSVMSHLSGLTQMKYFSLRGRPINDSLIHSLREALGAEVFY